MVRRVLIRNPFAVCIVADDAPSISVQIGLDCLGREQKREDGYNKYISSSVAEWEFTIGRASVLLVAEAEFSLSLSLHICFNFLGLIRKTESRGDVPRLNFNNYGLVSHVTRGDVHT